MRPATNSTIAAAAGGNSVGFWQWNSPMPYLFGGLAVMLILITVALIILVCSYRKSLSRNEAAATSEVEDKPSKQQLDSEPKIVVIMAGDHNPTFLAKPKPVSFSCNCQNQKHEQQQQQQQQQSL